MIPHLLLQRGPRHHQSYPIIPISHGVVIRLFIDTKVLLRLAQAYRGEVFGKDGRTRSEIRRDSYDSKEKQIAIVSVSKLAMTWTTGAVSSR